MSKTTPSGVPWDILSCGLTGSPSQSWSTGRPGLGFFSGLSHSDYWFPSRLPFRSIGALARMFVGPFTQLQSHTPELGTTVGLCSGTSFRSGGFSSAVQSRQHRSNRMVHFPGLTSLGFACLPFGSLVCHAPFVFGFAARCGVACRFKLGFKASLRFYTE